MQYRRDLEIDLRRALAQRQFALVYQPQFNLRLNRVTGFEALLRWQSPARGSSPLEFIRSPEYRYHYLDRRMGASDGLPASRRLA